MPPLPVVRLLILTVVVAFIVAAAVLYRLLGEVVQLSMLTNNLLPGRVRIP